MKEELMDGKDRLLEEIRRLKELLKGVREERDYLFNKLSTEKLWLQQENTQLKQQLKDKDEKISEVKELLKNPSTIDYEMYGLEYSRDIVDIKLLLEILESNKED